MKSYNSLNRIASLLFLICAILMSTFAAAQDAPHLIQVNKKESPVVTVQSINTPAGHQHPENSTTVHHITMEKSEKMEIVNPKNTNVTSKQATRDEVAVIRKTKSEKIDQ